MACVAVPSLVRTIELEFLQPQPRPIVRDNELISGNKELIESLLEKLEFLMEQFDEHRMDDAEAIKDLEIKLRDVAFRVEDEIEVQVVDLYVKKTRPRLRFCQIFHRAIEEPHPRLKLHHILRQAIKDINHIEEELVKVKNEYKHIIELQGRNTSLDVLPKSDEVFMMGASSKASPLEDIMVGKNDEFKTVKELLIEHPSKQREVVSIKGMGGIGKTTLVRRVYEDPSIVSHFDKQAWVVASQHHNKRQMLEGLLNLKGCAERSSDEELELQLFQSLKGRRYLVVMDDVWSRDAWDAVRACFPDDRNGSRVLLTTRLAEVANYVGSYNDFSHQMNLLDQSESWNLFCEKSCISHDAKFEAIAKPIVEKCRGLPLAIVMVAGLFSKLSTLYEWKKIEKALNSSTIKTIADACSRILSLSYNHLPHNLKACFLYLGVFPEDKEINANNLGRLWAAEGFVKASEKESPEAVAEKCIEELKDRNLILVSRQSSNGRKIKTFRMHDVLHAFCVREAQNKNLLNVVSESHSNFCPKDFRWVSIQSSSFGVRTSYSSKSCRSIFYFAKSADHPYLNLQNFNILRVLYSINMIPLNVHPVHLRYVDSLGTEIVNSKQLSLWNLQTVHAGIGGLPYSLDLPQLRYCYHHRVPIPGPHTPKFVHQNLQSISGLSLSCCTKQLVTKLPCLKKVKIRNESGSTIGCIGYIGNLAFLQQLESLAVEVNCSAFKYPINNEFALLKNLKKLSIKFSHFEWEEINVLSVLPRLEVLKLHKACEGQKWKLREEDKFCQLIFLKISGVDLEDWEVSGDHFPKLEHLVLLSCEDLRVIPSSFAEISTLKSIELWRCLPSAVTSAKQIQGEQRDYGNDNVVIIEKETIKLGWSAKKADEESLREVGGSETESDN